MDKINILLSTDNNYVMPTGVLMHSIGMHNEPVNYFILVNEKFSDVSKPKIRNYHPIHD